MNKTIQIELPEYLTINHYKLLNKANLLSNLDQRLAIISAITNQPLENIKSLPINNVVELYTKANNIIKELEPEFYPVIEWNDKLWGYSNMSHMSFGEYIDLDNLTKETDKNINQILALLYRPVTKNKLTTATYLTKSTLKALKYDVENVFDYYELEEYDPTIRKQRADEFDNFPMEIAMGAMTFFLDIKAMLLSDSQIYSLKPIEEEIKKEMSKMNKKKSRLLNTTAGFIYSKKLANLKYYQSQVINPSLT